MFINEKNNYKNYRLKIKTKARVHWNSNRPDEHHKSKKLLSLWVNYSNNT